MRMDAEAVRLPLLRHVRHPFVDTRERMPLPPVEKFAVCAYPTLQYGAVVFDAGDLHFVGRLELESQDCPAGFGGQRCGDPVGDTFETAVVARTFADVDHVDLPQVVVAVAVKGMPLDAGFVGGQQVAAFDVLDGGVDGKPRHGGETVARMQRCGVDVEIDVAVSGQQPAAQRADKMGFGADRLPDLHQPGFADDLHCLQLLSSGALFDGIHDRI